MKFKELLECLADEVGYHQVPINSHADQISDLFENCALHHDLMLRLMRAVYRRNNCQKLTDEVKQPITLEAIAPIRLEVLRSSKTDIDTKRFIDDLCIAVTKAFENENMCPQHKQHTTDCSTNKTKGGEVIFLEDHRQRLKSLS